MPSVSREAIYSALFAKLQGIAGFKTASRRLQNFMQVSPSQQPALYQLQRMETAQVVKGIPTRWNLKVDLFLYVWQGGASAAASSALNPLLDAVEAALRPDNLSVGECTLGGLVSHCRIEGPVEIFEGVGDGNQTVAVLSINLMTA